MKLRWSKRWTRRVLEWCGVLAVLWGVLFCVAGCLVNRVAFHPLRVDEGWRPAQGEEVFFEGEEGRLHGVLLEAKEARAVVVYMHGNAGNIDDCQWLAREIREALGVTVFVWDYPGYGKSEGRPTPSGVLAAGRAAVKAVAERTGMAQGELVIWGRSIGGAVAVDAACHAGAKALVVESSFVSLKAMCERYFWLLPWGWILSEPMDSEAKIAGFAGPVCVAHGDEDGVIPFRFGERLFAAAREPKMFFAGKRRGHNDGWPREFYAELENFLVAQKALKERE